MKKNSNLSSHYLDLASTFIKDLKYDRLNPEVLKRAKWIVLDTLGAILAGIDSQEVEALIQRNQSLRMARGSTIIDHKKKYEPKFAALIHGVAATWHELDEGSYFSKGHAAAHILPAALAIGEKLETDGKRFLESVIAAYEISSRIGCGITLRKGMHPHGTWGTIGAAIAPAKLMGFNPAQIRQVIDLASSLTLATSKHTVLEGANVEKMYAGISGFMGILANELYTCGFKGDPEGVGEIFGKISSEHFNWEIFSEGLGETFEMMRNYFKGEDACCRYISPTLDALGIILARKKISAGDIKRIDIHTFELASLLSRKDAGKMLAAKFSIPYTVALFIIKGSCSKERYDEAVLKDEKMRRLAKKIEVREERGFSKRFPEERPSRVTVHLTNGQSLSETVFYCRGDAEKPFSEKELLDKFIRLASPILRGKKTMDVIRRVEKIEELRDIRGLLS